MDCIDYIDGIDYINDPINTVTGGDITFGVKYKNYLLYFFIAIIIIIIFILLYLLYKKFSKTYKQKKLEDEFLNTSSHVKNEHSENVLNIINEMPRPRLIDTFRAGTVLMFNNEDYVHAREQFENIINRITEGEVEDAEYIIDRLMDYDILFREEEMAQLFNDDIPIAILLESISSQHKKNMIKETIDKDDPDRLSKLVSSNQQWYSDPQNVHDSAMNVEFIEQYNIVAEENDKIPNIGYHTYEEFVKWIRNKYSNIPEKKEKLEVVLTHINEDVKTLIPNVTETKLIETIWRRSYDPRNKDNAIKMREALGESIMDCVEYGSMSVCPSGRNSKVWGSLATLDVYEDIGILKSKQLLKNEIRTRAAKIISDYVGPNGTAPDELKLSFNNGEESELITEMKETIKKEILELKKDYENKLNEDHINMILHECISVIE